MMCNRATATATATVAYVLVYVQDGGWEIVRRFVETVGATEIFERFVKPFMAKADRAYRVYANSVCDVLKGDGNKEDAA